MADRRTAIALYLLIVLPLARGAVGQDRQGLEQKLQADYVGKCWIIKGFYGGGKLVFDASGKLAQGKAPESWTLAGIEITHLRLREAAVEIEGKRAGYIYDPEKSAFSRRYLGVYTSRGQEFEKVKITLQLAASASEATIRQAIEGVLAPENQDITSEIPDYWRGFIDFTNGAGGARILGKPSAVLGSLPAPPATHGPVPQTAPVPLSTPDPQYSEAAQKGGIQGISVLTIAVDSSGKVTEVRIKRPVGFGLDEKAVETVRRWTFRPAERDGEPVPVTITVEVSFRLH
jgi:TonB family protein